MIYYQRQCSEVLIDSSDDGSGGGGEDVGKLTRKRLNRGLPGRKQGTVRNQVDFHTSDIGENGSEHPRR